MNRNSLKNVWLSVAMTVSVFTLSSVAFAVTRVAVIPIGGAVGNATVSDVVKGKTFSTRTGKGLTGTLELLPTMQTYTTPVYGMTFNLIPSGTFIMGSPADEPGRGLDETQHQVTLTESFYLQISEVTQKQWRDIVLAAELAGHLAVGVLDETPSVSHLGVYMANYPVENVSWENIRDWINALNQLTGESYALPTEAQWEYAARATTTTIWAYLQSTISPPIVVIGGGIEMGGGFNPDLIAMGWYFWNNANDYVAGTKPVAKKQPNKWGLYDMHGNVYEWCHDWHSFDYYTNPGNGIDPQGPVTGQSRVFRGGSWKGFAVDARSAFRDYAGPGYLRNDVGFRLALPSGQ
jgi:formylglycine-generating enzyme required for sulfatase activity